MKGQQLRKHRGALGMTQVELAKALGVTANTVARWERNEVGIPEPAVRLVVFLKPKAKGRQ